MYLKNTSSMKSLRVASGMSVFSSAWRGGVSVLIELGVGGGGALATAGSGCVERLDPDIAQSSREAFTPLAEKSQATQRSGVWTQGTEQSAAAHPKRGLSPV